MSDIKKLLESLDAMEGPMPSAMPPMMPKDEGNPVTMNVSLNASGKEHVEDLINMMKNAGMDAKPVQPDMMPMRMDMERLRDIVDEPGDKDTDEAYSPGDENAEGMVSNCCSAPVQDERNGTGRCSACGEGCEAVAEEQDEAYDNEPDAQFGDMSDAIPNGNDLVRKKKAYAKAQDGDNAMAVETIKASLMKALAEKKKPDADGDGVPDWADKKPGKDDNEGKKKGSKPKKGVVPPQFKK